MPTPLARRLGRLALSVGQKPQVWPERLPRLSQPEAGQVVPGHLDRQVWEKPVRRQLVRLAVAAAAGQTQVVHLRAVMAAQLQAGRAVTEPPVRVAVLAQLLHQRQ